MHPALVRFRSAAVALACALAGFAAPLPRAEAANASVLTAANDVQHALSWAGTAALAPAGQAENTLAATSTQLGAADQTLVVRIAPRRTTRMTVWVHADGLADLSLRVTRLTKDQICPDATLRQMDSCPVASSDTAGTDDESVSFTALNGSAYVVHVVVKAGVAAPTPLRYTGYSWLASTAGTDTGQAKRLRYVKPNACADPNAVVTLGNNSKVAVPPPPCYFTIDVPVTIVMVGFDKAEVDPETGDLLGALPSMDSHASTIKPVVASESGAGGLGLLARDGGATARQLVYSQGTSLSFLPFAYRYHYKVVTASEQYSRSLFAAAKSFTTPGDYTHPQDRAYLESYNARASALRRAHPVLPGTPVDFIDAMKLEDWIAAHPPAKGMSFDLRKPSGGYTFFMLDTYRPSYAGDYFNLSHYHALRVMNASTTDPDTGAQLGFDWGRVWGGRYRFLIEDTGAAPNSFEGSTQKRSAPYRTAFDGDSALTDPPVWEYTGCQQPVDCRDLIPTFYQRLSEDLLSGMMMRFLPSYASRPHGTDRVDVASQTWEDQNAYTPWPSNLSKLFKPAVVASAVRDLFPVSTVNVTSTLRYLSASDEAQGALDEAVTQGGPAQPDPQPVMRFVDGKRASYAPIRAGTLSIPVINVVQPGARTWEGADSSGSLVAMSGADAWGVFNALNDVTKPRDATETVTDSSGTSHGPVMDPRAPSPAAQAGFTSATLRMIGGAFGLFPATRGVLYQPTLPPSASNPRPGQVTGPGDQYKAYFVTSDDTWATTATPMSEGWFYGRFEVLDRDAIGRAQAIDWLDRSLDDVSDAFAALDGKGYRSVPAMVVGQVLHAGTYIGQAVAGIIQGLDKVAITSARAAKRETEKIVAGALSIRRR